MENPGRGRWATRPIPLAILGLMIGVLGLMYQLNYIFYLNATDFVYVLWAIGFFLIVYATWEERPEPPAQGQQ